MHCVIHRRARCYFKTYTKLSKCFVSDFSPLWVD
jgi:hypothetical protein